ncbi:hypothetical protein NITHO_60004 [Nitrolancea hollandica Lb]|uniref:Uncharacterized protein n=1 Tax=Nitrolancea hollandica Lb TaxID=1129897 RepID=I4EMF7_9BACT|nr:hypothetical protein NITHO_60004 [Nitrolancea hollandica Lb]
MSSGCHHRPASETHSQVRMIPSPYSGYTLPYRSDFVNTWVWKPPYVRFRPASPGHEAGALVAIIPLASLGSFPYDRYQRRHFPRWADIKGHRL